MMQINISRRYFTIERLNGNRLHLKSTTQFRIYTILPRSIIENFEIGWSFLFREEYDIYLIYFYIFNIYSMIGNDRDWHGEIR